MNTDSIIGNKELKSITTLDINNLTNGERYSWSTLKELNS